MHNGNVDICLMSASVNVLMSSDMRETYICLDYNGETNFVLKQSCIRHAQGSGFRWNILSERKVFNVSPQGPFRSCDYYMRR